MFGVFFFGGGGGGVDKWYRLKALLIVFQVWRHTDYS